MKHWIVLLCCTVVGCASADREVASGPCAQRSGAYSAKWKVRDGNCGDIPEQIDTLDKQPTEPAPPCTGTISYSNENCTVTVSSTCPGAAGYSFKISGIARWSEDANSGTAVLGMNIFENASGRGVCSGSYDVTYTKL